MTTKEIIELLKEREKPYLQTKMFSQQPGIYAFFYIGDDFPLLGNQVAKHQIIYIGKTESSQESRDSKTHFTSDKTGSSTVRKSIGSLLCAMENLTPIPRNDTDYKKGKYSHFTFEHESEKKITTWMENNLALSFYEYPKTKQEIEDLETEIIGELVPILNISKNPKKFFKGTLKQLRKNCATMARKNSGYIDQKPEKETTTNSKSHSSFKGFLKEGVIYIDNITIKDVKSRIIRITVGNKNLFPSEQPGNPQTYLLNFTAGNEDFIAQYRIGSKDGKSRSGVLRLGEDIYTDLLKIREGTGLKIRKSIDSKYKIEKS